MTQSMNGTNTGCDFPLCPHIVSDGFINLCMPNSLADNKCNFNVVIPMGDTSICLYCEQP